MAQQTANLGQFDFSDAPGGDLDINQIFGNPEIPETTAQPMPELNASDPVAPFLKTATGTEYNSAEDAIRGIEHKDALLERARQEIRELTGQDIFNKQYQRPQPQQQVQQQHNNPDVSINYGSDAKKYMADLNAAVTSGREEDVVRVQQKFIMDSLAPYTATLSEVSRSQALNRVTSEVPDFTKFMNSEDYGKTLDAFPLLRNSIQIAETNPQAAGDLSQLYRMAYDTAVGRNMPRIVQEQRQQQQAQPIRPTVSSTPMTPTTNTYVPAKTSLERNRNTVQEYEGKGVLDLRF